MTFNLNLVDLIDARIASARQRESIMATVVADPDASNNVTVIMDGSSVALPVKCFGNVKVRANDRVGLTKFGTDWVISGTFGKWLPNCQVADPAARDAAFPASTVQTGQSVWTVSTGELEVWNGSAWISAKPRLIFKPTATSRSNTTTLTDDPHLILPVEANATYLIRAFLSQDAGTTEDIKTGYSYPSGTTAIQSAGAGWWQGHFTGNDTTGDAVHYGYSITDPAVAAGGMTGAAAWRPIRQEVIAIIGGTAGNLAIQWAQNVSGAATTQIGAGSYLETRKIG